RYAPGPRSPGRRRRRNPHLLPGRCRLCSRKRLQEVAGKGMRRQLHLAVEFLGALKATLSVSNYSTQGHVILSTACEDLLVVSNTAKRPLTFAVAATGSGSRRR